MTTNPENLRRLKVEHRDDAAPNDYGMVLEQVGKVPRGTPAAA